MLQSRHVKTVWFLFIAVTWWVFTVRSTDNLKSESGVDPTTSSVAIALIYIVTFQSLSTPTLFNNISEYTVLRYLSRVPDDPTRPRAGINLPIVTSRKAIIDQDGSSASGRHPRRCQPGSLQRLKSYHSVHHPGRLFFGFVQWTTDAQVTVGMSLRVLLTQHNRPASSSSSASYYTVRHIAKFATRHV